MNDYPYIPGSHHPLYGELQKTRDEEPRPTTCRDCGGTGLDYISDGGGSCSRCGGAGVEGGYRALRGER